MALSGSPASARATWRACHRPMSLSGMSRWPWMRVSTFQAVSPWRMAMMRVACMGSARHGGMDLAWPGGWLREAAERRVEQHAKNGGGGGPHIFLQGRGLINHLLRCGVAQHHTGLAPVQGDRKSTRLNSSHSQISYAVFCLKKY